MTEWIENGIAEVQDWSDGRGCDVKLFDDKKKYYYVGKNFPKAGALKLMIREGGGDRKGQYEIIDFQPVRLLNPEFPKTLETIVQPGGQVLMPLDKLREIMSMKSALKDSRIRALDAAVKIYTAMDRKDKTPIPAADTVMEIANIIESFLICKQEVL